jgi:hypothetical protein
MVKLTAAQKAKLKEPGRLEVIDPKCAKCGRKFDTISERRRHQCPG